MGQSLRWSSDTTRREAVHFSDASAPDRGQMRKISRVTWVGAAVNIALAAAKATAGAVSGSRALLADAAHTISDFATDFIILVGVRYWTAPADADHPHGHRKIETMATFFIGLVLAGVGIGMGYEAAIVLAGAAMGEYPATGDAALAEWAALAAALLSLAAKELLYRWTAAKGVELVSPALVANAWHHRSDALSSIPAALAIGGNLAARNYGHDLRYLDPIGTLVVCVMLLQAAWGVAAPTLGALLDASADHKLCADIRKTILATGGVIDAHRVRTRSVGPGAVAVDLHIVVAAALTVAEGCRIADDVRSRIMALDVPDAMARAVDVMVHVEPAGPEEPDPARIDEHPRVW